MVTISVIFLFITAVLFLARLYNKSHNAFCKSQRKLHGKTAIVTGGTSGLGLEIAKDFAKRGARVIIACPFNDEGKYAKSKIIQETGNSNIFFKELDLGSFNSVRDFAADVIKSEDRLDILMNNAGIGPWTLSMDGLNRIMRINYYGHFLLTLLLLPLLKKSAPSRVINTCSIMHRIGRINKNHMNFSKFKLMCPIRVYENSKLCFVHFAREMTTRLKDSGVTINNADPGIVGTPIWVNLVGKKVGYIIDLILRMVFKTPFEGAQTAIHTALDDSLENVSGEYFVNCTMGKAASRANCEQDRQFVWDYSVRICGLTDEELKQCFK